MQSESLFNINHDKNFQSPLADRLRPKSLDELLNISKLTKMDQPTVIT